MAGLLIILDDGQGHRDSLSTDGLGVARTGSGLDTLVLRPEREYYIDITWPKGPLRMRDKIVTGDLQESTTFVKEYFLHHCIDPYSPPSYEFPSLYFLKNSVEPRTDNAWYQGEDVKSFHTAITEIVQGLIDNPTTIIRAIGYCDPEEKNCDQLSLARANYVRDVLIEKGIPGERIQTEGHANVSEAQKAILQTIEDPLERELAMSWLRMVKHRMISFDYVPTDRK